MPGSNWCLKRRIRLERRELLQGRAKVSELYTAGLKVTTKKLEIGWIQYEKPSRLEISRPRAVPVPRAGLQFGDRAEPGYRQYD